MPIVRTKAPSSTLGDIVHKKAKSKKPAGYVDCKIYGRKIVDDADSRMVGIEFGDLRLKTITKLVMDDDSVKSHHKDIGYLLRALGKHVCQQADTELSLTAPEPVFSTKTIRVEFKVAKAREEELKKALRRILKKDYRLNVAIMS
jgi:hypothetical protein